MYKYNIKLPDINKLDKIVEESPIFIKQEDMVNGQRIVTYNYLLQDLEEFKKHAPYSFEMRGVSFNLDTGDIFLSIPKFFNYKENDLVTKPFEDLLMVTIKIDGSLVIPTLINDKVVFKTKKSFKSKQALLANEIINSDKKIYNFIYTSLKYGYQPLFELHGPNNIHIIKPKSNKDKLILTMVRSNLTGEIIPVTLYDNFTKMFSLNNNVDNSKLEIVFSEIDSTIPFDRLVEGIRNMKRDIEGIVVYNNKKINSYLDIYKIKTNKYVELHKFKDIFSSDINIFIKNMVKFYLNDTLDDISHDIFTHYEKEILKVENIVKSILMSTETATKNIYNKDYSLFIKNRAEFYKKYKDNPEVPISYLMKTFTYLQKSGKNTFDLTGFSFISYLKTGSNYKYLVQRVLNEIKKDNSISTSN